MSSSPLPEIPSEIAVLLLKDEKVLYAKKPTLEANNTMLLVFVPVMFFATIFMIPVTIAAFSTDPGGMLLLWSFLMIFYGFGAVSFCQCIASHFILKNAFYVITDTRTIKKSALISTNIEMIKHKDVRAFQVHTGPFQKPFGLSSVTLTTAAEGGSAAGNVVLWDIDSAEVMKCLEPFIQ